MPIAWRWVSRLARPALPVPARAAWPAWRLVAPNFPTRKRLRAARCAAAPTVLALLPTETPCGWRSIRLPGPLVERLSALAAGRRPGHRRRQARRTRRQGEKEAPTKAEETDAECVWMPQCRSRLPERRAVLLGDLWRQDGQEDLSSARRRQLPDRASHRFLRRDELRLRHRRRESYRRLRHDDR